MNPKPCINPKPKTPKRPLKSQSLRSEGSSSDGGTCARSGAHFVFAVVKGVLWGFRAYRVYRVSRVSILGFVGFVGFIGLIGLIGLLGFIGFRVYRVCG